MYFVYVYVHSMHVLYWAKYHLSDTYTPELRVFDDTLFGFSYYIQVGAIKQLLVGCFSG